MSNKLNLGLMLEMGFDRATVKALEHIQDQVGISDSAPSIADVVKQFEEYALSNLEAQSALAAVEELRGELQATRGYLVSLQAAFDDLTAAVAVLASIPNYQTQINELNESIAALRGVDQLRNRIESIEDRLA